MTDFTAARISDHARTGMARCEITEAQLRKALLASKRQDPPEVVTVCDCPVAKHTSFLPTLVVVSYEIIVLR